MLLADTRAEVVNPLCVDGVLMRWEEHGNRSGDSIPIVLVHGLPTNPRVWRYVIPEVLRDGGHCLA